MKHWKEYCREEISRLEFAGKSELLEQIASADEAQRRVWLEETQKELRRIRKSLLNAMVQPQFAEVLHSAGWHTAQQEFRMLLRLEAVLQGRDPEQALAQSSTWNLASA